MRDRTERPNIDARRQDGNYKLNIEVTATEGDEDTDLGQAVTNTGTAKVTGVIVGYEQAYYDAVEACSDMLQDISDKYAKSKLKFVQKGARATRNIAILEQWQEVLATDNPVLAEQIGQASRALKDLQALQARR